MFWSIIEELRESLLELTSIRRINLDRYACKKQDIISKSSIEAEYRAMAVTTSEIFWLRWLLVDMGVPISQSTPLHCDNRSAIQIARNSVFNERTKHIEIDCHFTRHHLQAGTISLPFVPSALQIAYVFTKPHSILRFRFLTDKLSMFLIAALLHVLIMEKSFLTAKGRGSGKGVKEKHNSVLDDSGTKSNKVNEAIGSPSTRVSNEEPKLRDSLGGKHNVESDIYMNLGTPTDTTSTPIKDANLNNTNVGPVSFATILKGDTSRKLVNFRTLVTSVGNVVEKYVKNTWSKFGLVKSVMTKCYNKESPSNKGTGSMATTSGMHEKGQSSTPIVDKINVLEKQIMEGKLVLVDDDGNPLEKVDYPANLGIEDEVELVEPVDYPAIS
ncbi:hypothetical protein Tco_0089076 [Tanacetum coccineum]